MHYVSHLQSLLPHATLEILQRLSKSICGRRLELLRADSYWKLAYPALGDDAILRMMLLEFTSDSNEAVEDESSAGSSLDAEDDSGSLEDAGKMESSGENPTEASIRQMDSTDQAAVTDDEQMQETRVLCQRVLAYSEESDFRYASPRFSR